VVKRKKKPPMIATFLANCTVCVRRSAPSSAQKRWEISVATITKAIISTAA
jgi:hypothetical protein